MNNAYPAPPTTPTNGGSLHIHNVSIKDCWLTDGPMLVSYANNATGLVGQVDKVTIDGVHIAAFSGTSNYIFAAQNNNVGMLDISNVWAPSWNSNSAPVRVVCDQGNVTINYADVRNIYPVMTPSTPSNFILSVENNGVVGAYGATVGFSRPIDRAINSAVVFHSAPTVLTFQRNQGTASITSGTTSTVVTHNISYTPTQAQVFVVPTSTLGSAAKWWVDTIGASSFTIHTDVNPAQTVTFAWQVV